MFEEKLLYKVGKAVFLITMFVRRCENAYRTWFKDFFLNFFQVSALPTFYQFDIALTWVCKFLNRKFFLKISPLCNFVFLWLELGRFVGSFLEIIYMLTPFWNFNKFFLLSASDSRNKTYWIHFFFVTLFGISLL